MMKVWHLLKNDEEDGLLFLPTFPTDYKNIAHSTSLPAHLYLSQVPYTNKLIPDLSLCLSMNSFLTETEEHMLYNVLRG